MKQIHYAVVEFCIMFENKFCFLSQPKDICKFIHAQSFIERIHNARTILQVWLMSLWHDYSKCFHRYLVILLWKPSWSSHPVSQEWLALPTRKYLQTRTSQWLLIWEDGKQITILIYIWISSATLAIWMVLWWILLPE